jgi:hypothetical protein
MGSVRRREFQPAVRTAALLRARHRCEQCGAAVAGKSARLAEFVGNALTPGFRKIFSDEEEQVPCAFLTFTTRGIGGLDSSAACWGTCPPGSLLGADRGSAAERTSGYGR